MTQASYSPALQQLLSEDRVAELGPGQPNNSVLPILRSLTTETAFAPHAVRDKQMAEACLAGIWLYHDFPDESHRVSQDLDTTEGSYWHGLMHRREPDFGNAKYWFRKVGTHPVFGSLAADAAVLAVDNIAPEAAFLKTQAKWDAFAFIDLCEAALSGRFAGAALCKRIQHREWQLLFDYCYRGAVV